MCTTQVAFIKKESAHFLKLTYDIYTYLYLFVKLNSNCCLRTFWKEEKKSQHKSFFWPILFLILFLQCEIKFCCLKVWIDLGAFLFVCAFVCFQYFSCLCCQYLAVIPCLFVPILLWKKKEDGSKFFKPESWKESSKSAIVANKKWRSSKCMTKRWAVVRSSRI